MTTHTPNDAHDLSYGEHELDHNLSESLRSFEGSAAEARIIDILTAQGVDPKTYDTKEHDNYQGLPASETQLEGVDRPSPILRMFQEGIADHTIIEELVDPRVHMARPSEAMREKLRKLHLLDATVLRDAKTGDIMGYSAGLSGDGAARGGAIVLGPKDLDLVELHPTDHAVDSALSRRLES